MLLALLCSPMLGQRYTFRAYTQADGLDDLNVHSLFQDRAGFLWVGTEGGLFRYDGKRFVTVSLGNKGYTAYITSITQDATGHIWVASDTGLHKVEDGEAKAVLLDGKPLLVTRSMVPSELDRDGVVVVVKKQLWAVKGENGHFTVEPIAAGALAGRKVSAVAAGAAGHLWVETDAGLIDLDRGAGRVVRTAADTTKIEFSKMLVDHAGNVWLRGRGGVARLQVGASALEDLSKAGGIDLTRDGDADLAEDAAGHMLTLHAEGIARWEGSSWKFFGKQNGLEDIHGTALTVDTDGDVWFGKFGHGLRKWLGYREWEHWTVAEGLGNAAVWGMTRDAAGRMVVADSQRLNVSADGLTKFEAMKGGIPDNSVARAVVRSRDGSLWAGGGQSNLLMRFGPGGARGEAFNLQARVFNLRAGAEGDVWVATEDGIYRAVFAGGKWKVDRVAEGAGAHGMIYEIAEGQHGEFWATGDNDLFHYAHGQWTSINLKGTPMETGLANVASGPELPEGTVWLSGNFPGVARLTVRDGKAAETAMFHKPQVSSDRVVEIGVDHRGWTWVSTDHGVSVFNGVGWRSIMAEDGLLWNDCDSYGFFADDDGSVWISTSSGLSHLLDPVAAMKVDVLPVKIVSGELGKRPLAIDRQLSLPWSSGALTIRFASPTFRHEGETAFQYRLSDVDADWVSNDSGEARYAKVPPGDYRFEVMAENRALNERSPIAFITFEILPPWWRTLWFRSLVMLATVGLLLLVLLWRERFQLHRMQKLEALVAERTALLRRETEELKVARKELTELATRDSLTSLWNRRAIMDILFRELDRQRRDGTSLVIALVDLDHFKQVNDTLGHPAGDAVLREASARLQRGIRSYDAVGRFGGEEFLLVLPGLSVDEEPTRLDAFHAAICQVPFEINGEPLKVTCSIGALALKGEAILPEHAIQEADEALYRAKNLGRARIEYARRPGVGVI